MYYRTRRIHFEYLALLLAIAALGAAVMYNPPHRALATGYTEFRVLFATEDGNLVHLTLWSPRATNVTVSGDINASVGTLPAGVFSVSGVERTRSAPATIHVCFKSQSTHDCGVIYPLRVS